MAEENAEYDEELADYEDEQEAETNAEAAKPDST